MMDKDEKSVSKTLQTIGDLAPPLNSQQEKDWLLSQRVLLDLQKIASFIECSKEEIFAVPVDSLRNKLPTMKGELQSVIDLSAEATHVILESSEAIESFVMKSQQPEKEKMLELITSIYESCTFQDINGQRIQKVIKVVSILEDTLIVLIDRLQKELIGLGVKQPESDEAAEDPLLNGPASQTPDQQSIDDLFSKA